MKSLPLSAKRISLLFFLVVLSYLASVAAQSVIFIRFEAESGTVSGQTSVASDSGASGGSYVSFTDGTSNSLSFLETFDGTPTTPLAWNNADWDVTQTSRDRDTWDTPESVDGHHSSSTCGDVATGGTNFVNTWEKTVFNCNNHVMTSISGGGYAAIYLSPPVMLDWSAGPATLKFDVSTFTSSDRDWIDVWVTPWEDVMSYPFGIGGVDGVGEPGRRIHFEQDFGSDFWRLFLNGNERGELDIPFGVGTIPRQSDVQGKVVRTPVEITISSNSMTMRYPGTNSSRTVTINPDFNRGIVQFGHHSYNPTKGSNPATGCEAPCGSPNTWHWDNVSLSPAVRFYQRQAMPERTGIQGDTNPRTLTFAEPVPANAQLHFTGTCNIQVRDNASAPWRNATPMGTDHSHPEHTWSWKTSVPQGSTSVQFRFQDNDWYGVGLGCHLANPVIKALL